MAIRDYIPQSSVHPPHLHFLKLYASCTTRCQDHQCNLLSDIHHFTMPSQISTRYSPSNDEMQRPKTIVNRCSHLQPIGASPVFKLKVHPLELPPAPIENPERVTPVVQVDETSRLGTMLNIPSPPPPEFTRHCSSGTTSSDSSDSSQGSCSPTPLINKKSTQLPVEESKPRPQARFVGRLSCLSKEQQAQS